MSFTKEEIKKITLLLLSADDANAKLAFAILEGKEYPPAIKSFLEEHKTLYKALDAKAAAEKSSLEEVYFAVKQIKKANLSYIEFLELAHSLYHLTGLTYLTLDGEKLSKNDVMTIATLKNLEILTLWDFDLSQANFTPLKPLEKLIALYLHRTNLSKFPTGLGELTTLEYLSLEDSTHVEQTDFNQLASLKNLKILNLRFCDLACLPKVLSELTALESLDLFLCKFTQAPDFTPLIPLKNLKHLDIRGLIDYELKELPPILEEFEKRGMWIEWEL